MSTRLLEGYQGGRRLPYDHMDLPAICRLPIEAVAAPNAVLAMWINGADLDGSLQVVKAWGFRRASQGLTWNKLTKGGMRRMGLGHRTRKTGEWLALAIRGKGLRRADMGVQDGFGEPMDDVFSQRRENSRKLDEAYVALERLYGDVRRLELFGRRDRPGWTRWGNELLPSDSATMLPFTPEEMFEELRPTQRHDGALS